MTLNEYTYDAIGLIRSHHQVDDDDLDERKVRFWIHNQRSEYYSRKKFTYVRRNVSAIQSLGRIYVDAVDRSYAPVQAPVEYRILRSKTTIPRPIMFGGKGSVYPGLTFVGPMDITGHGYNFIGLEEVPVAGSGRFNQNQIYAFYLEGYVYLFSKSRTNNWYSISEMNIQGIFEDPTAVADFTHATGEACYTPDSQYPMSSAAWEFMKERLLKINIDALMKVTKDEVNNDSSEAR